LRYLSKETCEHFQQKQAISSLLQDAAQKTTVAGRREANYSKSSQLHETSTSIRAVHQRHRIQKSDLVELQQPINPTCDGEQQSVENSKDRLVLGP